MILQSTIFVLMLFVLIIAITVQSNQYEPPTPPLMMNRRTSSKYSFNMANDYFSRNVHYKIQQTQFHQDMNESVENRVKRELSSRPWMTKEFSGRDDIIKMHAFIVRDENILPCCNTVVKSISNTRHFMCSGALLTLKHAITSASCMHFADVYEHHINAELAILIGAFSSMPHSIKINRFEMHPNYDYDVESNDLSTYDLAILFLNCSLSSANLIIPRLPRGFYDDIGHVCCGKKCELMTIIQSGDDRHVARILAVKYLPSPIHNQLHQMTIASNDDASANNMLNNIERRTYKVDKNMSSLSSVIQRVKKSPRNSRLAEAPSFFLKALQIDKSLNGSKNISRSLKDLKHKRDRNIFDEIANARRGYFNKDKKSKTFSKTEKKSRNKNNFRNMTRKPSHLDEETLTSIDWKRIEEKLGSKISDVNRAKMEKFTKKLVDVTMKRVDSVVDVDLTTSMNSKTRNSQNYRGKLLESLPGSNLLQTFLPHDESSTQKNHSLNDFAVVFANILKSVAVPPDNGNKLMVSSDLIVDESDLGLPPSKYVDCPPLGTPIFRDGVLIAMIAYTCDDVQNWVEWKYVSISRNIKWIKKRISVVADDVEHQQPSLCDESLPTTRSYLKKLTKVSAGEKQLLELTTSKLRKQYDTVNN